MGEINRQAEIREGEYRHRLLNAYYTDNTEKRFFEESLFYPLFPNQDSCRTLRPSYPAGLFDIYSTVNAYQSMPIRYIL